MTCKIEYCDEPVSGYTDLCAVHLDELRDHGKIEPMPQPSALTENERQLLLMVTENVLSNVQLRLRDAARLQELLTAVRRDR